MQSAPRHQNVSDNHSTNQPLYQGPSRNQGHFNLRANRPPPRCQLCDFLGHIAKYCPQLMQSSPNANFAAANANWILDSGANHHITSDLNTLSLHWNYEVPNSVTIGDGSDLAITHMGSTHFSTPSTVFLWRISRRGQHWCAVQLVAIYTPFNPHSILHQSIYMHLGPPTPFGMPV